MRSFCLQQSIILGCQLRVLEKRHYASLLQWFVVSMKEFLALPEAEIVSTPVPVRLKPVSVDDSLP